MYVMITMYTYAHGTAIPFPALVLFLLVLSYFLT